jgi:hypothetical protein
MARPKYATEMPGAVFNFLVFVLSDGDLRFRINSRRALLQAIRDAFPDDLDEFSDEERSKLEDAYSATLKLVERLPEGESRMLAAMLDGWWLRAVMEDGTCLGCHWDALVRGKAGCEA